MRPICPIGLIRPKSRERQNLPLPLPTSSLVHRNSSLLFGFSARSLPCLTDEDTPFFFLCLQLFHTPLTRARLPWLLQHHTRVPVLALFSFINGCISIGLMAMLALITRSPFIFPSLGSTAFLFFYTPTAPAASPRNTIVGHAIGVIAGYFSLLVTGLTTAGPALAVGCPGRV